MPPSLSPDDCSNLRPNVVKGIIPRRWLDDDERELELVGEGYLQGLIPSEMSESMPTTATERRVVMLGDPEGPPARTGRVKGIFFQVPWTCVHGYWQGKMPLPPERWRDGPEAVVLVLVLDPETAGGQDVVLRSNLASWVDVCRTIGISEIVD
jgi:hypothetical protein